MIKINSVEANNDFSLELSFDDNFKALYDFDQIVDKKTPLTESLYNIDFFKKVEIFNNGRRIFWPNEFDVCADYLRNHAKSNNLLDAIPQKS